VALVPVVETTKPVSGVDIAERSGMIVAVMSVYLMKVVTLETVLTVFVCKETVVEN